MDPEPQRIELAFPATLAAFGTAFTELRAKLDGVSRLRPGARYNVELVFEEIVANIVRHGAPDGRAVAVRASFEAGPESIVCCFEDDGIPFDPCGRAVPAAPKSLDEAPIGGLGLVMVRRAASALDYVRTAANRNRLVVTLPAMTVLDEKLAGLEG